MLIRVLQMSRQGMRSVRIHKHEDPKTGKVEKVVHFAAPDIDLGHVIAESGQVVGPRNADLNVDGSRVREQRQFAG